jgi:hypothetical protein
MDVANSLEKVKAPVDVVPLTAKYAHLGQPVQKSRSDIRAAFLCLKPKLVARELFVSAIALMENWG